MLGLPSIIRSEWQARSFQKGWGGAHHLKMAPFRHLLFKRSRGGSQKFSFMIFFHPFPSPSSLGGWFFDGTYSFAFTESACRILPGNDVELQKHLQASRNRLGKILKVSWKQWSVGGLELLMWLKESSCGYGCLG